MSYWLSPKTEQKGITGHGSRLSIW